MASTSYARPKNEKSVGCSTTSIATTPLASSIIAPTSGYICRLCAAAGGTTTGTITVAVAVNGGSDITASALTIAAGSNARAGSVLELPVGISTACVPVYEGDCIVFTPSGGTGASIPGAFSCTIRTL